MNYKTMANIFSGLSQTGAWGCFDEFNRIPVEVLSVVAGQYGALLDGIKALADTIIFEEETINLKRTIGAFITMNPGYAGRTELPENLKALFRGVAMCTPDFAAIIEIELSAEGFVSAKTLSIKFIRLFQLNMELLSKQDHYDWGLRAIKGILRIAGGAKRANPERTELEIMMRALRDSNVTKFVNADVGIFLGLVSDIFPKMTDAVKQADKTMTDAVTHVIKEGNVRSEKGLILQPEDIFISKTVDLAELLGIRHCVFALGAAVRAGDGETRSHLPPPRAARAQDDPSPAADPLCRALGGAVPSPLPRLGGCARAALFFLHPAHASAPALTARVPPPPLLFHVRLSVGRARPSRPSGRRCRPRRRTSATAAAPRSSRRSIPRP